MVMHIASLLDKAQLIHRLRSDYKLALVLGISQSSLGNYRQGKTLPDARIISKLCDLTGDDAGLLLAQIEAERAKTDEARALWQRVAARLAATLHCAVFAVLAGVALAASFPSAALAAGASNSQVYPLYIVECCARGGLHRWRRLAPLVLATIRALLFGGNHVQGAASTAAA